MENIKCRVMMASEWEVGDRLREGHMGDPGIVCLSLELVGACVNICFIVLHTFRIL